jgi:hypothetical protein
LEEHRAVGHIQAALVEHMVVVVDKHLGEDSLQILVEADKPHVVENLQILVVVDNLQNSFFLIYFI